MRVDLKKYLFIGPKEEKSHFFRKAQEAGIVHFIDPKASSLKELPEDIHRLMDAIKIVRHLPPTEQEENFNLYSVDKLVEQIIEKHQKDEKLQEDLRVLKLEISRVAIFGDFSKEEIEYLEREGKCRFQFFCGKPRIFENQPMPDRLFFVGYENGLDYYFSINSEPVVYDKLVEMKIEKPVGVLQELLHKKNHEQSQIEHELKTYAKFNDFFHHALIEKLNKYDLYNAQSFVQIEMDGLLFAVEGWVPVNKIIDLEELMDSVHVHAEEIAIEPQDTIPTFLDNTGVNRLGEDLVNIYDTPSANDKDPSLWVMGSFTLFFAMIIGDAGYGLLYLALALLLRYKFPDAKGSLKRFINLFTILCVGCIVWGVLTTSFFGMNISMDNPIRKLSLTQWLAEKKAAYHMKAHDATYQHWVEKYPELSNVKDPHEFVAYIPPGSSDASPEILGSMTNNILFELALFVGVVHVIFSLARYLGRNWQGAGWIAFLIGSYLYFATYLDTPSILNYAFGVDFIKGGEFGLALMIAGIAFAWIVSIIRNGFTGTFEIMTLIQVVADILSYLRLYALGLAGAIVSATINELAGALPAFFAVLLILLAHFVNIILSTMGGVIHGLRLNFIEWYHYSFEGGGKKFRPLKTQDEHR